MNGLPKGMIPDRDNVVYYDTEKNLFYMILWEDEGDRDTPRRIYINEKEKDNVTASKILMKYEDENEYHFHESDRYFIIEAMEEYAKIVNQKNK
jgi:hypothetical protein